MMVVSLGIQGVVWAGFPMPRSGQTHGFVGASLAGELLAAATPSKTRTNPKDIQAFIERYRKRGAELDNFIYEAADGRAKAPSATPAADTGTAKAVGLSEFRQTRMKWWLAAGAAGLLGTGIVGYMLLSSGSGKTTVVNIDYSDSTGPGN